MKKVSIVNKFGPTGKAITGRSAKEVADFLVSEGIEVTYICLGSEYKSVASTTEQEQVKFTVKALRDFYKGSNAYLRLLWGFIDGCRLWLSSLRFKADVVIIMTDPPLLFFWFQLFRRFSKRRFFYWTMDIYPEAFVAGKYINPRNIFYRMISSIVYKHQPELVIALGEQQLQFLQTKFKTRLHGVVLPCGIIKPGNIKKTAVNVDGRISFCYGGNIGEAHDASFLVSLIEVLNPQKHIIYLSLYGSKSAYVQEHIQNTAVVQFRDSLSYNDIAAVDVNVATILPEWNHICVPSKAVTAVCCGSPLLLNATRETDAWNMFNEVSWTVESSENYLENIKSAVGQITKEGIATKKIRAEKLMTDLINKKSEALKSIVRQVKML